jgi:lon-related putative ATP-dependent protease
MPVGPLLPQQLYRVCDCEAFNFKTTEDLRTLELVPGQSRALEAIRFGAAMPHADYHLFLLGAAGTGRHLSADKLFRDTARSLPTPSDWVYVHNFQVPHQPRAISLPPGRGPAFAAALKDLMEELRTAIPTAFERPENQRRIHAIEEAFRDKQEAAFNALSQQAQGQGIALMRTEQGFSFAPLREQKIMPPEDFAQLPEAERKKIQETIIALQGALKEVLQTVPRWDKERRQQLAKLNHELIAEAIAFPLGEVRTGVKDVAEALEYLDELSADLIANFPAILAGEAQAQQEGQPQPLGVVMGLRRYQANVIVTHAPDAGAPVVYEANPTLLNLMGRAEHVAQMGTLITDFTLLKGGALHRANGGFLVIDAEKLLMQPFAWDALKRNLKAQHIAIESPAQYASLIATVSLEPEPIPLKVRIALVGSPMTFHLLQQYDDEFAIFFKVAADFGNTMTRSIDADENFARLIATMVRTARLRPFDINGVARLIEESSRQAEDSAKLSLNLQDLWDLVREADFFAGRDGVAVVGRKQVAEAVAARVRRADRIREASHEQITRDILLIDTDGAKIGQINGLSVLQLGRFSFGKPTRITVAVRMGLGRLVDIEREVNLGGPLHSKGVLILQGFLAGRFLPGEPLSLSASLVFEQSYGGVDGDSASSTECYALLSALAEAPIRQDLAVTGSVNQKGEVQAIGGVNDKIEGFFDICKARGLTGKQGVLIPKSNIVHLMLRDDVVAACANAEFHIYPIANIEEGAELLTGLSPGERGADGNYPADSLYGRVESRLRAFAQQRRRMDGGSGSETAKT